MIDEPVSEAPSGSEDATAVAVDATTARRIIEAVLFAAVEPLTVEDLQAHLGAEQPVLALLRDLQADYAGRGVQVEVHDGRWTLRTAPDLGGYLERYRQRTKKLSPAALETLAIIAYRQPVSRAEIEQIRGVSVSRGTLDLLVETGWVRPRGRKPVPGRPVTWVTTPAFLDHFDLSSLDDLPRVEELASVGLFDVVPEQADAPSEEPEAPQ